MLTLANCYTAMAMANIHSPKTWTTDTINQILLQSKDLLDLSNSLLLQSNEKKLTETTLQTTVSIDDDAYSIKVHLSVPEIIGHLIPKNTRKILNIWEGLKTFFKQKHRFAVFKCESIYLLIWRYAPNCYMIFDSNGRSPQCEVDKVNGKASLICVANLKNISYLIVRMSQLCTDACYVLSELKVIQRTKEGVPSKPQNMESSHIGDYKILNDHCAIVSGTINISNKCFKGTRNQQSMITSCIAFLYNKIHPPNSWNSKIIDKIIMIGNDEYRSVKKDFGEFSITDLPSNISIGQYTLTLQCSPLQSNGQVLHTINIYESEFMTELKQFFIDHKAGLIQIDTSVLAIWQKGGMFYMFDPYGRNYMDQIVPVKNGAAYLQMHSTVESMGSNLYTNLMKIFEKEYFQLYGIFGKIVGHEDGMSLNESVNSFYVPEMVCSNVSSKDSVEMVGYNLDSPALSETQFIRTWSMVKNEIFGSQESLEESGKLLNCI